MRKRTRSFANRLGMWIMAVLIVMSLIIMGAVYWITRDAMAREAEERYQSIVLHSNEKIRGVLSDVYVAAINNIDMIEHDIDDPDKLQAHLERIVSLNKYMSSCRLIFEPDVFPQKGHNFEIYAWKQVPDIIKSKQMNETHPDFLVHSWYKPAFEKEEGSWTPPYFDRAASQQLTVTYLIHVHDRQGRKIGMLGADVSLQWLRQRHKKIDEANHNLYEKGVDAKSYGFVIDKEGNCLIHPNESRVLKENFFEIATRSSDLSDDEMIRNMMKGEGGICKFSSGEGRLWIFYSYVKYAEWTIAIVVPEEIIYHKGNVISAIILAVLFVGLLIIYISIHSVIARHTKALMRFATATEEVANGHFDNELPAAKSTEVTVLRNAFTHMQESLRTYIDELKETTASKVAIEQELKIASDIQQQMLPKVYPPYPERGDIDIYGEVVTAKKVGGDLFDFFIRDDKLFFSIGDVAGKGVPAALVMAVARSMFRSASMSHTSPQLIVESINRSVCQCTESYMFVTLFMGVLDLATGHLLYTNAGHEPPLLIGRKTRFLPVVNNIPLGLRPEWEYNEQEETLGPGEALFLYTDGFTEAMTIDNELYGKQRMYDEAVRLAMQQLDSCTFVKTMRHTERTFVNFIPQSDDISLLAIKYIGSHERAYYRRHITLANDVQEVPALAIFVGGICEDMNFNELATAGVNLAVEEAVVNVMNYAYPEGSHGDIDLDVFSADEQSISFVLRDYGEPFDPTETAPVDVSAKAVRSRPIGGLGIHLIRHYMDSVSYERVDDQNVLTMTKLLIPKNLKLK